jgi:ABC-2 type transport system permease protein
MTIHPPRYSLPPPALLPRSRRVQAILRAGILERLGTMNIVLLALIYIVVLLSTIVPFYLFSLTPIPGSGPAIALFYTPFSIQVWFFFTVLLAASVGAGVIAGDVASRSLTMYLSRPISRLDYLVAKSGAVAVPLALGALLPGLIAVIIVLSLGYISLPVALVAAGVYALVGILAIASFTGVSVLFSAVSPKTLYAGAAIFGSLVATEVVAAAISGITNNTAVQYVSLDADLIAVAQPLLNAGGNPLDPWVAGGILVAFSVVAFLVAYLRLARTEVVTE